MYNGPFFLSSAEPLLSQRHMFRQGQHFIGRVDANADVLWKQRSDDLHIALRRPFAGRLDRGGAVVLEILGERGMQFALPPQHAPWEPESLRQTSVAELTGAHSKIARGGVSLSAETGPFLGA